MNVALSSRRLPLETANPGTRKCLCLLGIAVVCTPAPSQVNGARLSRVISPCKASRSRRCWSLPPRLAHRVVDRAGTVAMAGSSEGWGTYCILLMLLRGALEDRISV